MSAVQGKTHKAAGRPECSAEQKNPAEQRKQLKNEGLPLQNIKL